ITRPPPRPTLFPYTTLFRSCLTTTFCGPHDEEPGTDLAGTIESPSGLADSRGPRLAHDPPIVPGTTAGYLPGTSDVTPTGEFTRSEEHTSELQSLTNLVCRL